mgnify:CR=1 FL=1
MEKRKLNRITAGFIVLVVMVLILMFSNSLRRSSHITLPEEGSSPGQAEDTNASGGDALTVIAVTPETVQSVIRDTLSRPDRYTRAVTIEDFWGEGESGTTHADVWVDGGWTHTRLVLNSGVIRHNLVGDGTLYYWYEGSSQWLSVPADDYASDLSQHIPTYETVLELDQEDITSAGYDLRGDTPCIYVEVTYAEGHLARYWVGVDSGLLVCAEEEQDGQLTYRMTASNPSPCPSDASFVLPDGTDPK